MPICSHSFDRVFQGEIPLPLARLYARAYHAKGERERHDHAFHLLEASLKLAAAVLVARYKLSGKRSAKVDAALEHLAMPSLGQWRDLFRETLAFLAGGNDPDPWARKIVSSLEATREDGTLFEAFSAMARAASYRGRASTRVTALDLIELLPAYRNSMSDAHGSIKADPAAYREATPALLVLVRALLDRAALFGDGRLVYAEDVHLGKRGERRVTWIDLSGSTAVRRQVLEGEATEEPVLPGRLHLETGPGAHLSLHPLVYYQAGETLDQVFFLNRARSGKGGIQFLSYETGEFYEPGRDPTGDSLVADLDELLSWATSRKVSEIEREALAARSRSDAQAAEPERAAGEAAEPAGTVFGDFEILGELGRGGMAVVYQARQRSLGRMVALKVLPPALKEDPVSLARFQREVRALSRCDHANVVKILSSGEAAGTSYYAMEFIDGSDLAAIGQTLKRYGSSSPGPLNEAHFDRAASTPAAGGTSDLGAGLPEASRLEQEAVADLREGRNIAFRLAAAIRDAARGVQHIHDHGIIHRDLKPQNIMVTREEHRPVVMDLGLSKVTGASQSLTMDRGSILGTLRYMPPEQLQRNLLEVDARADVYALGAVLYELACLRPMLDGDTEERLTTQILFEEPPPPQKVSPLVPTDLATIIAKATRKDPRERYSSAAALADDLDRFIHGEAIGARPPTLGYLLRLFLKRHRAAVAAAALGLLMIVLLVVGWIVSLRSSWEKERQARVDERTAREEAQGALVQSEESLARANKSLAELFLERADRALEEKAYQRAAVLAAASLEKEETPQAREKLFQARARAPRGLVWTTPSGIGKVRAVAFSPDGARLAAGTEEGQIHLFEVAGGAETAVLEGHTALIRSLAFSPDGARLASGSRDGTVRIWDPAARSELFLVSGHSEAVNSVAFGPDGKLIASGSRDGTIRLWDSGTGKETGRLEGHASGVEGVAISASGNLLVSGSRDGTARIWDIASRKELSRFEIDAGRIFAVTFARGEMLVACGCEDGTVRLWDAGARKEIAKLEGHTGRINTVSASPDGAFLVSTSYDTTVRLWDLAAPKEIGRLEGHDSAVYAAAVSPRADIIASGSGDGTVRLWDRKTNKEIAALSGHGAEVSSVAFNPDGKHVASGSYDRTIRLWDAETGREEARLEGHTGRITAVAFSPDGLKLASASLDYTVRIWDVAARKEIARLEGQGGEVICLAYLADGRKLAAGMGDTTIRLWDTREGKELASFKAHTSSVGTLAASPDGKLLASGSYGGSIRLWDLNSLESRAPLLGHEQGVSSMAFAPDGTVLASGSWDGTVRFWETSSGKEIRRFTGHRGGIASIAFSPDGKLLASASGTAIGLRDRATGNWVAQLEGHVAGVNSLAFDRDGSKIVSGASDRSVGLWDLRARKGLIEMTGHTGAVTAVAFSPDGKRVFSSSTDGTVRIWDPEQGETVKLLQGDSSSVHSLAVSPDGKGLAAGTRYSTWLWDLESGKKTWHADTGVGGVFFSLAFSPDGGRLASGEAWTGGRGIRVWDLRSRKEAKFEANRQSVYSVAFHPDGAILASGSGDATVRLWEVSTGREIHCLWGHTSWVRSVAFSPDGRLVASGSADKTVRIWNRETGREAARLEGHGADVRSVAFSPDGSFLASGSDDSTIRLWAVPSGRELARLSGAGDVNSLAFGPDAQVLVSGSGDRVVRIWKLGLLLVQRGGIADRVESEAGLLLEGTSPHPLPRNRLVRTTQSGKN